MCLSPDRSVPVHFCSQSRPEANLRYNLTVRQQPVAARACGNGDKDRRVIDPPPILELGIQDLLHPEREFGQTLGWFLASNAPVVNCSLYDEFTGNEIDRMPGSHLVHPRPLMGTLCTSQHVAVDEDGQEKCWFQFSDLSVRPIGRYRLRFRLCVLDTRALNGPQIHDGPPKYNAQCVAEVTTHPFDVLSASKSAKDKPSHNQSKVQDSLTVFSEEDFRGFEPSTDLTKHLSSQGIPIKIKKGNRGLRSRSASGPKSEDEEATYRSVSPDRPMSSAMAGRALEMTDAQDTRRRRRK